MKKYRPILLLVVIMALAIINVMHVNREKELEKTLDRYQKLVEEYDKELLKCSETIKDEVKM